MTGVVDSRVQTGNLLANGENFVQEALDNFMVLIDDLDYKAAYEILDIGVLHFLRRKQMFIELKGLHMALWRLALSRSFPNDADSMFPLFLRDYASSHTSVADSRIVERAREYWGMLMPQGGGDFSAVARHLLSFSPKIKGNDKALTLKLALYLNTSYNLIFDRLI